ncbi:hypothetical protein EV44_g4900 [Erysiphe necator]|uniref:Uncharacterized protein n=1 Tax=Uncinula necator TaxID=52586 RepID=A0A0B1PD22_UNCNE|nr:hypothetical protein EV44_g4900 [Erysiphe necator]
MSDTPAATKVTPTDTPNISSNAAEQARIRKERREAKIRAGSTARLNKITGLNKEQQDSQEINDSKKNINQNEVKSIYTKNEILSSSIPVPLNNSKTTLNEDALREIMRQFNSMKNVLPNDYIDNNNPFNITNTTTTTTNTTNTTTSQSEMPYLANNAEFPLMTDDPMMKIMQQLMGPTLQNGKEINIPSVPISTDNQEKLTIISPYAYIWRVLHTLWAITFGFSIAISSQFTGTEIDRERSFLGFENLDPELLPFTSSPQNYFYLFITIEAILIGTRYILDREDTKPVGILGMLLDALQEPIRGYLLLGLRYINIWKSVSRDAMICIFILGAFAWWRN